LIILAVTIAIFTVLAFRKSKTVLIILIILIFFDLFSWGHFMDRPRSAVYMQKNLKDAQDLKFLTDTQPLFRIYPKAKLLEDFKLYPNMNINYDIESISGHDPLLLKSVGVITDFPQDPDAGTDWKKLLHNNTVLSMLNTKYIILDKPPDTKELLTAIDEIKYYDSGLIFNLDDYLKGIGLYSKNITKNNELTLTDTLSNLEKYEFPLEIKKNQKYLISFYIKSGKNLNNNIYFDFFGQGYDNPSQEFSLSAESITENYQQIFRVIDAGDIPENIKPVFRIFTNSGGSLWIKNLEIHQVEITDKKNYRVVFSDESNIVLENLNYLPRFYFVEKIIKVSDLEQAKEILWKEYRPLDTDRFDPAKTALAADFKNTKLDFNVSNSKVEITSYRNNSVKLKSITAEDEFLVFSDGFDAGWQAFVDGKNTEVYRVNGMLKGILVPKGDHEIIFRYRPPYFVITGTISIATLVLILGAASFLFSRKRKNK
ncbi:MAG TPA: YfhO family protein, partial [Candidatus Humimicrobiaceae bacterium]